MLQEQLERSLKAIGINEIIHPIFYNSNIGIRFEIGTGDIYDRKGKLKKTYIDNGLKRVMTIYKYGLSKADILMWQIYCFNEKDEKEKLDKFMKLFNIEEPQEKTIESVDFDDGKLDKVSFIWNLNLIEFKIEKLFIEIIKADLGGFSELVSSVFLFNTKANIIFYLYDDRGLDIVSENKECLFNLYEEYEKWILDYDRERIDSIFQ